MSRDYIQKIQTASVYDVAKKTPLKQLRNLSKLLHNRILLKREDLQPIFSFKIRGAYNKIYSLTKQEKEAGIITSSAGNHAQGVALAAKKLGLKATIVMPATTPSIKVKSVKKLGGIVHLHGDTYDETYEYAQNLAKEKGYTFIHPYDDPDVIAGQGTVAKEILEQSKTIPDIVFIPVGGGGLIAGMSIYLKTLHPEITIIGVEPDNADCLKQAMEKNERVILKEVGIFADGVAVRQIGKEPFEIAKKYVDGVITATTDEICASIKDIFDHTRSIAEPAGALALAGLKKYVETHEIKNKTLIAINSGANVNFDRLQHISERAMIGEHNEALVAVKIPEKPGSFKTFCNDLGKRGITEFNYRYNDPKNAVVFVGIRLQNGEEEKNILLTTLKEKDYAHTDLTHNELAKLHIRHMVGGTHNDLKNELIFRFEFPERPGALLKFLSKLGSRWNISLFHYRNHGSAYGRVLAGFQIPQEELPDFKALAEEIGYPYEEETQNPAYQLFL